jgi:hypothetical protein
MEGIFKRRVDIIVSLFMDWTSTTRPLPNRLEQNLQRSFENRKVEKIPADADCMAVSKARTSSWILNVIMVKIDQMKSCFRKCGVK